MSAVPFLPADDIMLVFERIVRKVQRLRDYAQPVMELCTYAKQNLVHGKSRLAQQTNGPPFSVLFVRTMTLKDVALPPVLRLGTTVCLCMCCSASYTGRQQPVANAREKYHDSRMWRHGWQNCELSSLTVSVRHTSCSVPRQMCTVSMHCNELELATMCCCIILFLTHSACHETHLQTSGMPIC